MTAGHLLDDQIDRAMAGFLDVSQESEIYHHIRGCAACEGRVREAMALRGRLLARGIHRTGSGELALGERLDADAPPRIAERARTLPGRLAVWGALAAVLVVALLFVPSRSPHRELYWLPASQGSNVSRAGGVPDERLTEGISLYHARRAREAVRILGNLQVSEEYEGFRDLYLAGAWLNLGEPDSALAALPDLRGLPSYRAAQAEWIRYLALDAAGRPEEARALLEILAARPGEVGDAARGRLGNP